MKLRPAGEARAAGAIPCGLLTGARVTAPVGKGEAAKIEVAGQEIRVVKPHTFMNLSYISFINICMHFKKIKFCNLLII